VPFSSSKSPLYRTLGSTDLVVSRVGLGTVALGLDYGIPTANGKLRPEAADAAHLLQCALDMGIKLIDRHCAKLWRKRSDHRRCHPRPESFVH